MVMGVPPRAILDVLRNQVAPLLMGQDAMAVEALWHRMFGLTRRAFWHREVVCRAIAVADAALWDVVGRALDVPLHRLWGGTRTEVPAICMAPVWRPGTDDAGAVATLQMLREAGAGGAKLKVGSGSSLGPEGDAARVLALREAMGDAFPLIADANQAWDLEEATRFARAVSVAGNIWLEEPCHWEDDRRLLAALRRRTALPVISGQMELTVQGAGALMAAGAVDVCNLDAAIVGPTAWHRMAVLAGAAGVSVVNHLEPQLGRHLAAACPHATHAEFMPAAADPFFTRLVRDPPLARNGHFTLPEAPGWGLEFDDDFLRHHAAA